MNKDIIISGYGGQGVLTLAQLISLAGLESGLEVKQSELHGLAQRGGSLQAHVRVSKEKIYSPLIAKGSADLIIAMDLLEGWRAQEFADKVKTTSLINDNIFWPYQENKIDKKEAKEIIEKSSQSAKYVDSDKIVKDLTGGKRSVNIHLFAQAIGKDLLPFDKDLAWKVVEKKLKGKGLAENRKVFEKGL